MRNELLVAAALALVGSGSGMTTPVRVAESTRSTCCYSNPRYAGTCAVDPAEGETCSTILTYLNNPMSQGKTYCASTTIRGGWRQRRCETPKAP